MLQFRTHEKNLFGQVRSWAAVSHDGQYIIERAATSELFQARFQIPGGKPQLLKEGAWMKPFARARTLCDSDAQLRLRRRIMDKSRK